MHFIGSSFHETVEADASSVSHIAFFAGCAVNTVVIWDDLFFCHHGLLERPQHLRPEEILT